MSAHPVLGIIGGSGLYRMPGIENLEEHAVNTPFGAPTSSVVVGDLAGLRVAFVSRHGIGHIYSPTEVNYRANIFALKSLGVQRVIGVSASGSLREDYAPGHLVVPDQLFDHTRKRENTFFEGGLVAHVGVADPFCAEFSELVFAGVTESGAPGAHQGGAFITIEGPRFSTRAESQVFQHWGMALVGMTTATEAFLAREAEMCYSVIAHVTDYDVWHQTEEQVSATGVFELAKKNISYAQNAIRHVAENYQHGRHCDCPHALENALSTNEEKINPETLDRLRLLVGRYYS